MADQHIGQAKFAINGSNSNFYFNGAPTDWASLRRDYYQHLSSRCQTLSAAHQAIVGSERAAVQAEGLRTDLCYLEPQVLDARDRGQVERLEREASKPKPLHQALGMRPQGPQRFLLVGAGGMGKSTTLNHLVLQRMRGQAPDPAAPPLLLLRLPFLADFLPMPGTPMDKVAAHQCFKAAVAADVCEALGSACDDQTAVTVATQLLQDLKQQSQGLLLFDALDEVHPQQREPLVSVVCRALQEWAPPSQQHLVLLTGRPYAFEQAESSQLLGDAYFTRLDLQALQPNEQAQFVRLHFAAAEGVERDRLPDFVLPEPALVLLRRLQEPTLQELAQTPLVLFLMCSLAQQGRPDQANGLPSSRALLLDRVITLWQQQWDPARSVHECLSPEALQALTAHKDAIRAALAAVAARAYAADPGWQDMPENGREVRWESLESALDKRLPDGFPVRAHVIARLLKDRSSLVDQEGDGDLAKLRFPHNFFKEVLAVQHLWAECQGQALPFAFAAAQRVQAAPTAFQAWAHTAVDWLLQQTPDAGTRNAALQAMVQGLMSGEELAQRSPALHQGLTDQADLIQHATAWVVLAQALQRSGHVPQDKAAWCAALNAVAWRGLLNAPWRDRAASVLAAWKGLKDGRFAFDSKRWGLPSRRATIFDGQTWRDATPHEEPIPGFVRIEGGPFMRGEKDESDNPPYQIELPTFYMARTLTTVAQWQAFVAADGYNNPDWWTEPQGWAWRQGEFDSQVDNKQYKAWLAKRPTEQRHQPWRWAEQQGQQQPVWGINWFEARAYARWLNAQLQAEMSSAGLAHWQVRLPTEDQTERAQRAASLSAADERRFPWGDDEALAATQANGEATGLSHASPVGLFAPNPLGLYDLAGNLWGWQDNLYQAKANKMPWPRNGEQQQLVTHKDLDQCDRPALRGGSWANSARGMWCAFRLRDLPDGSNPGVGVRLVLSLVP